MLFSTKLDATVVVPKIEEKQNDFESSLSKNIKDVVLKVSIHHLITKKHPINTIFYAKNLVFNTEGDEITVSKGDILPVYSKDSGTFYEFRDLEGMDYSSNKEVYNKFVRETGLWFFENPDYGKEVAEKFFEFHKTTHGFDGEWKDITEVKKLSIKEIKDGNFTGMTFRKKLLASFPTPSIEETGFSIDPEVWYLLVRAVIRNENVMVCGPTGCGKTEVIKYLAEVIGRILNYQDMGTVQDAQSALLGVHRINEEGKSVFDYAPFLHNIQTDNILLLDEVNR